MRKLLVVLLFLTGLAPAPHAQEMPHLLDRLILGDAASEKAHNFKGDSSVPAVRLMDQPCRILMVEPKTPAEPMEISFQMKVDPDKLNYFSLKYSGSDNAFGNTVYIDDMRIGVGYGDDYPNINAAHNSQAFPGRFVYFGIALPLGTTKGKTEVTMRVQTWPWRTAMIGEIYAAYTHSTPYLDFSQEKQGQRPSFGKVHPDISAEDKARHLGMYHERQNEAFLDYCKYMDEAPDRRLSIHKYSNNLRSYCNLLMLDWNPCKTPAEKRVALDRVFKSIDNWVKEYYKNYRMLLRGGHQGDWGGYFADLGEALYLVESMINDDAIMGKAAFQAFQSSIRRLQ